MVLVYEKLLSSIFNLSNSFFITILFVALINGLIVKCIEGSLSKVLAKALIFNNFIKQQENYLKNTRKDYKSKIHELHEKYNFSPLYRIIEVIPFLIQLPFLISIYLAILNFSGFNNLEFLFIPDLSKSDGLFYNYNVLPIIMFLVSLTLIKLEKNKIPLKDTLIPAIFLIILL